MNENKQPIDDDLETAGAAQQDGGAASENGEGHTDGADAASEPGMSLDEALAENANLKDKLLRALADVENIRQRSIREADEARRYAMTNFARDLLDVADNMRRALDMAPAGTEIDDSIKNLLEGVALTERSLLAAFEKSKISKVLPKTGDAFDHKVHQAMFEVPTADLQPGRIAEVMQAGYVIADRLLRPALVGVTKKLPDSNPVNSADAANDQGKKIDTQA